VPCVDRAQSLPSLLRHLTCGFEEPEVRFEPTTIDYEARVGVERAELDGNRLVVMDAASI